MKTFCLIRFGNDINSHISYILGLLSAEPITKCLKTKGTIITPFKTNMTIENCRKVLSKYGHAFILVDVTDNSSAVQTFGLNEFLDIPVIKPILVLTDDQKEKLLIGKQTKGIELTEEEHIFMQSRMKA